MSLGFQNAGFDIIAAFDRWEPAVRTYACNFAHPIYKTDLSDEEASARMVDLLAPDLIIGGPPCQDFSSAGKRNGNGERANLTLSFARIVAVAKPVLFVMENVSTIIHADVFTCAKEIFKTAGYGLTYKVLNAALCGVPQRRKRFIMIGVLGGNDDELSPYLTRHLSTKEMTVRDYFGDKLGLECYYRHPRSYVRRGIFSVDEPSPTIRGVNRPIPAGYELHKNDPVSDFENIRPLTTGERSQIQTFPKDFHFEGSKTDVEQMIGNAVPVKLAEFVARALVEFLKEHPLVSPIRKSPYPFRRTPGSIIRQRLFTSQ